MQSDGEIPEQTGDSAGWTGLHLLVGGLLGLRGIEVGTDALKQAASSTYPLVEGRIPRVLNIIGVYGGVLSNILTGEQYDGTTEDGTTGTIGVSSVPDLGHSDREGRQEGHDRPESPGVDNPGNKRKRNRSNSKRDGDVE